MQDINVMKRHQANMTSLVTLQALSNDDLLIEKKKYCITKLSVSSKTRVALLDPITKQH